MFYTTTKLPPRCLLGGDSGFLCAESRLDRHAELKFTAVTLSSHKTTWSVGQLAVFPALPTCFHTVRGLLCFAFLCRNLVHVEELKESILSSTNIGKDAPFRRDMVRLAS